MLKPSTHLLHRDPAMGRVGKWAGVFLYLYLCLASAWHTPHHLGEGKAALSSSQSVHTQEAAWSNADACGLCSWHAQNQVFQPTPAQSSVALWEHTQLPLQESLTPHFPLGFPDARGPPTFFRD